MKLRGLAAFVVLAGLSAAPAMAQNARTVFGYEDSDFETSFSLNFPALGITSSSKVFYTRFKLEIDELAGTARFTSYEQEIDPLILPLGISTGALRVQIQNSQGTYNSLTNTFVTNDDYNITFTNDLSSFGFESPVILPAVSEGRVTTDVNGDRFVEMDWQGDGELANSENPSEPYKFTYKCSTRSRLADSAEAVPALPTRNACGAGILSAFGLGLFGFVGMKRNIRRRR
ncbi:MAG: hypothetical protein H6819_06460 [Phycisphaerales bacterium]|nr:hypothetical protein [Phycisphaerales bacterium]MCB9855222.1 hypothetical protein [Phycisphaerales bacterium]MCB9862815.1 hypothetical protein [Phycisphaerales bacterium]